MNNNHVKYSNVRRHRDHSSRPQYKYLRRAISLSNRNYKRYKQKYVADYYGYETNEDHILDLVTVQLIDMTAELPQFNKQQ